MQALQTQQTKVQTQTQTQQTPARAVRLRRCSWW
jgi:hypothetical protein